jgi:DNA replication protein DnaC
LRLGVPLLVVDDLGLEPLDDRRAAVAVEELFHARQSEDVRTIVTTNLTPDEARRRYSERVFSRLAQSGRWWNLSGDDIRRRRR